jgi:hypothetical protein
MQNAAQDAPMIPAARLSDLLLRFAYHLSNVAGSCSHLAATTWIGTTSIKQCGCVP